MSFAYESKPLIRLSALFKLTYITSVQPPVLVQAIPKQSILGKEDWTLPTCP